MVAFDLLLLGPSPDDAALRASLDAHADHVVIGANLDVLSGGTINFTQPDADPRAKLRPTAASATSNAFPDRDGKVHSMTFRSSPSDLTRNPDAVVYDSLVSAILRKAGHADLIPAKSVDQSLSSPLFQPVPGAPGLRDFRGCSCGSKITTAARTSRTRSS